MKKDTNKSWFSGWVQAPGLYVCGAGRQNWVQAQDGSGLRAPGSGLQGSRLAVLAGRTGSRLRMRWSEARQGKH